MPENLDLLGVLGLWTGDIDFDLVRALEGSLGIVSPGLACYHHTQSHHHGLKAKYMYQGVRNGKGWQFLE